MSFTSITIPSVGEVVRQSFASDVVGNLNDLNSRLLTVTGTGSIPNGSFEADAAGASTGPTSWTWGAQGATPGTLAIVATSGDQAHGQKAAKVTRTGGGGDGGGTLTTSDFFEVSPQRKFFLQWLMKCTAVTMKNIVKVYWYKYDQSASATASSTIYSEAAASPTAWTQMCGEAAVPSDAKYAKIEFTLCDSSGSAVAGSTYIDGVNVIPEYYSTRRFYVTAAGTYTFYAPATAQYRITMIGGGGGGETRGTNTGSGGGGGETAIGYVHLTSGTAYTVVVGAGGANEANGTNSTFNSTTIVATAGTGGNTDTIGGGTGGTGGTVPTGGIKIDGQTGGGSTAQYGGSSAYGLGGGAGAGGVGGAGNAPGGGGGGGTTFGAGAAGGAIIEWNA